MLMDANVIKPFKLKDGILRLDCSSNSDLKWIATKLKLNKAIRQVPREIKSPKFNLDPTLKCSFEAQQKWM